MTYFLILQELDLPNTSSESMFHVLQLLLGFSLNIVTVLLLIIGLYNRQPQDKNQAFALVGANICVFLLMYMSSDLMFSGLLALGIIVALGFSRYQQEEGFSKTLIFTIALITLGLLNAQIGIVGYVELAAANIVLVLSFFVLHHFWQKNYYQSQLLQWYQLKLLKPQNKHLLLAELYALTGLNVVDVKVEQVDWEHQTALLKIYYPAYPPISAENAQNGQFIEQELPLQTVEKEVAKSKQKLVAKKEERKAPKKIVLKQDGGIKEDDY